MKTKDFADFADTSSGRRAATLLATHQIKPKELFDTILAEVAQAMPHLVDDAKYSTEMISGPRHWSTWLKAEVCVAGMCLAYLVRNRVVPLYRHKTPSGKGKALYCTQPSPLPTKAIQVVRCRRVGGVLQLVL
jgi:hypothetical protein